MLRISKKQHIKNSDIKRLKVSKKKHPNKTAGVEPLSQIIQKDYTSNTYFKEIVLIKLSKILKKRQMSQEVASRRR